MTADRSTATAAEFDAMLARVEAAPPWVGTVLESCIRDVALGRIASHSSVTEAMVADWRDREAARAAVASLLRELADTRAKVQAALDLHTSVEWHGMNDDGELDPDVVLPPFCRGCTADELVRAVEFGDLIDQGDRVIPWPCSTAAALSAPAATHTTSEDQR